MQTYLIITLLIGMTIFVVSSILNLTKYIIISGVLVCLSAIGLYSNRDIKRLAEIYKNGYYYLKMSDSPHIPDVLLVIDHITTDTAYTRRYICDRNIEGYHYQIYLRPDSLEIYDDSRLITKFAYDTPVGKILLKDNE